MPILALGVLWAGYGLGMTGWVLIRGYNVPLSQIWSPLNWWSGPFPPAGSIPSTQLWPGGKDATGIPASSSSSNSNPTGNKKSAKWYRQHGISSTSPTGTTNPK